MKMFLKQDLFNELKKRGITLSYSTLLRYERAGVIARPQNTWRLYSEDDVDTLELAINNRRLTNPKFGKEYMRPKNESK